MTRKTTKSGFSLIELILGVGLMVLVAAAFLRGMQVLSKGNTSLAVRSKVDFKLRSVAEAIRFNAGANFDTMTETNVNRSGDDTRIKVLSSISPIDPQQQYRTVTLTASWQEGDQQKSKALTFTIRRIRAKFAGAKLKIRVVNADAYPSSGVPGLAIQAPGQDTPKISGVTDSNGYCLLDGVLISDHGVYYTVDGESQRFYFDSPVASFKKGFQSAPTWGGELTDLSGDPVEIKPPVKIKGTVTKDGTSVGIANQHIEVYAYNPFVPFDAHESVMTDTNGNYSLQVVPGQYLVYLIGNDQYAGSARDGDYHSAAVDDPTPPPTAPTLVDADPGHAGIDVVRNFTTLPRSAVSGTVKVMDWSTTANQFQVVGNASNQTFRVYPYGYLIFSGETKKDLSQSTAWVDFWGNSTFTGLPDASRTFSTDSGGRFAVQNVGPMIFDETQSLPSQSILYEVMPPQVGNAVVTKSPLLPVRISTYKGLQEFTVHTRYGSYQSVSNYSTGVTTMTSGRLFPETPVDENVNYLSSNALATVQFNFYRDVADPAHAQGFFPAYLYPGSGTFQATAPDTSNNIAVTSGWTTPGLKYTWNPTWTETNIIPSPNPSRPISFSFFGWANTFSTYKRELIRFTGHEKALVDGAIVYRRVADTDMDVNGVTVHSEYINAPTWYDNGWQTVNAVDGSALLAPVYVQGGQYARAYASLYVAPGQTTSVDVVFSTFTAGYNSGRVTVGVPGWQVSIYQPATVSYSAADDALDGWIDLRRIATTPRVFGKVRDTNGNPIMNATITLWRSGASEPYDGYVPPSAAPYDDLSMTAVADALGDSSHYQFLFSNVKSVQWMEKNLKLTVSAPGYETVTESIDALDGADWERNFILVLHATPPPISDGNL